MWPRREIRIARSVNQIAAQLAVFRATKLLTAQDIEGGAGNITSIAFSQASGYAYVIPLAKIDGTSVWSEDDEVAIWELVEVFNADSGVPKAFHNASYDLFAQLWTYGICPQGPVWDTMEGMWELFPELAKGLDTAVSLLTRWPYYKPDKESDEEGGRRLVFESDEQFWTYNGMDAANTVEVWQVIWRLLRPGQREHWRFNSELCYPKMKAICTGLKVDLERVEEEKARAKRAAMELQARIDLEAAMSPAQVGSLLFDLYHGALDNEQAFAKLCLVQLCGTNPREKRQVVEERWQPMKGGGTAKKPKWVKAGKLLTTQDCNSAYGSEWAGVEETPVLVGELCFVAKHRTVEKLFPVEPSTLADLEPHVLDSKQAEWRRVKQIWKELAKGSEGAQALLGELSLLLSLGINTGSNSEDGDSQWFLFETCGLPKVFKDERKGRYSKEADQAWKARVKDGPKKRASKRKGNQADARARDSLLDASTVSSPTGKKPSTDQNALDLLYAATQDERALWVLQQRRLKKVVSDLSVKLDPDGRLRFNLTLVKETGRMSASANKQLGTGNNPMALNKDLRRVVVAEEGYEMGQIDLEGADSWTVAAELAALGDRAMMLDLEAGIKPAQILCLIYLGMIKPGEQDRAKIKALVKETKSGWPDWLYPASKSCLHGSSYGMGWQTMKATVLKYSMADLPVELGEAKPIVLTKAQIDTLQGGVFARYPKLKHWHEVEGANLLSKGWIETSGGHRRLFYGRKREVKHGHWVANHDTLKEVLATKPQFYTTFTVKRVWHRSWHDPENRREDGSLRVEILLLVHDSIGPVRWRVEDREFAARKLRQWFDEVVLEIAGQRVRIPADGTRGLDWGMKPCEKL